MAEYRLRYFFEPGSGICLWAANDPARRRWGYPVDVEALSLPINVCQQVAYVCSWYDTSLDWEQPSNPSPWDTRENARFNAAARELLALLRKQLGPEFEIVDQSGTADAGDD